MGSLLSELTHRGATPALTKTLAFNEARLRMIAQNVANMNTPGYRTQQLDVRGFQQALRKALTEKGHDASRPLEVRSGREVTTDARGVMKVTPSEQPVENVLFHDGTNQSLERQMAALAETGMMHDLVTTLLTDRFNGLRKAIRGQV